ncbi:glycosyltransferase [Siccirubricoccus phaeus]|uniref:glycosyltransferase n=1 Tax=Siccirubricoccus phaeus TaxID=2595053 RepID=UPI0011F3F313|nr:glycosyltransferase [Siccirubricoccus phaeus]
MAGPLLLHVFPGFGVGGAQVRFAALANRFGPRWRHAILALDGNTACTERLSAAVPYTLVPAPPRGGAPLARLAAIRRLVRALRPALLVTSNWGAIEYVLANWLPPRLPHLHTEDGFGPDEAAGQKPRRMLVRRLALRRSEVAMPSTVLLRAAREGWRLPEARLHHIPNGLDLARFRPGAPAARLAVPGAGPLIGTVAALRPEKNITRLLHALALLRREGIAARLAILGDGPERPALEALAAELGLLGCTGFLGHWPDPAPAYGGMDLLALSSDTEQMPFSVMEAMASGLPVAATEVGDLRAMLAPENLPHLAARDPAALAAALRPLLLDAALRARLGAANRAKAERDYDQEKMYQAYAGLIEGLLYR